MSDDYAVETAENVPKPRGTGKPFKKGFDQRRWLQGAPRKPKDKVKAEELLEHVIWDVLSEDLTNPNTGEKIDRLRAMIRSMTTSKQSADKQAILERIAGKVLQNIDVNANIKGELEIGIKHIDYRNGIPVPADGSSDNSKTSSED